jgi:FAD/FMN-containing dehydrogenase
MRQGGPTREDYALATRWRDRNQWPVLDPWRNGRSVPPPKQDTISRRRGATVTVDPGVVLDQLNSFLAEYDLFFAPMVSTGSRATIGGMIATDASGKGSRLYGKTSAHVASMEAALSDGSDWTVQPLTATELEVTKRREDMAGPIHREVHRIATKHAALIAEVFPSLDRGLTCYNLRDVMSPERTFNLVYLLAGSEGTLAITKSATLRILPRPRHRSLVVAGYTSFDTALCDVRHLMAAKPTAIEVMDDRILELAARDVVWPNLERILGWAAKASIKAVNFIEMVGQGEKGVARRVQQTVDLLATSPHRALDWSTVVDPAIIGHLWSLREKAGGLLGRMDGTRQGTAFVEDTAVPPERLADFVGEFRAILDRHG